MAPPKIPPPDDFAKQFIELEGNARSLAKHYGVAEKTVRERWMPEIVPQIKQIELTDVPKGRPAAMLKERDLDPEVWQVRGLRVNEWEVTSTDEDGEPITSTNVQTRLDIVPKAPSVRAARADGWKPPKIRPRKVVGAEVGAFVGGDHQSPYYDLEMHKSVCRWLAELKPPRGVYLGDGIDLTTLTTHPSKRGFAAAANTCLDSMYGVLCDYRSASPDTIWDYEEGNHEYRLYATLMRQFEEGAAIRRAGEDQEPVLSVPYLLRLDELGIKYHGNYPHDVIKLSDNTAVIHGNKSKPGAGSTAQAETKDRRYNIFIGHNHKQAITPFTNHDIDGNLSMTYGIEVGASCQVKGGLGYAVRPDWQNGCATATFDKDGTMTPELMSWTNGKLRWRGGTW